MKTLSLKCILLVCAFAASASASTVFEISIDTGSISGTIGSLDAQFNAGPGETQTATAEIYNLATDGSFGSSSVTGEASTGTGPDFVTIGNGVSTGSQFNDFFGQFRFGNSLEFEVILSGPAIDAPNGLSTGGSTFAFSAFSDPNGTMPVLTNDPNGLLASITIDPNGMVSAASASPDAAFAPEPGYAFLLLPVLIAITRAKSLRRTGR